VGGAGGGVAGGRVGGVLPLTQDLCPAETDGRQHGDGEGQQVSCKKGPCRVESWWPGWGWDKTEDMTENEY